MLALSLMSCALLVLVAAAGAEPRFMGWEDTNVTDRDNSPNCEDLPSRSRLVVSFVAPPGIEAVDELNAVIDFCTAPDPLPEWWRFDLGQGCREDSMRVFIDFSNGPFTHPVLWPTDADVVTTFVPGFEGNPALARIAVTIRPGEISTGPLEAGTEYYAFGVEFGNPTTGCNGCDHAACFIVNSLTLTHSGGIYASDMDYRNYATWQGGPGNCPFIVPIRQTTWGQIKAVFRE